MLVLNKCCQADDDRFARILRKLSASPVVTSVVKYKPYYTSELFKRVCMCLVPRPSQSGWIMFLVYKRLAYPQIKTCNKNTNVYIIVFAYVSKHIHTDALLFLFRKELTSAIHPRCARCPTCNKKHFSPGEIWVGLGRGREYNEDNNHVREGQDTSAHGHEDENGIGQTVRGSRDTAQGSVKAFQCTWIVEV